MAGRLPEPGVPRDQTLQLTPALARAAAGVVGFACTGLLAAGLLDAAPVWLRVVAALMGLVVAPALTTLRAWSRALGGAVRGTVVLPASLLGVVSLHALLAAVFTLLRAPFSLYSNVTIWGALLWCGVAVARGLRRGGTVVAPAAVPWGRMAIVVALLATVAALVPPHYTGAEDAYDHIGYVRRVMVLDTMRPDGVLAMPVDAAPLPPDPRKGAFHDLVAVCADLAGADPADTWGLLRLLMYPLAVLAFAGFAGAFVRGGAMAACMALFLLSYPGTTFQLVNTAVYGQNLAAAWLWVLAALTLRGFGSRGRGIFTLAALVCAGVVVHLGVAVHTMLLALSLVAFAPWAGLSRRDAWRVGAWMVLGVAVGMGLRGAHGAGHANEIHAHLQGVMTVGRGLFVVSPMEILRQYGLVFLGALVILPLTVVAARYDARARRVLALSLLPVLLAFVPPLATFVFQHASYMSMRALLNVPAFAGAVVTVSWLVRAARSRGVLARLGGAVFLLFILLRFLDPSLRAFALDLRRVASRAPIAVADRMTAVVAGLPVGATVLADPVSAYSLSAYASHRFVAILQQHANPLDPLALDRLQAVRDVLSPYAIAQSAVAACRRYGVDFVVLSRREPGVSTSYLTPEYPGLYPQSLARLRSMPGSFREFARGDGFVVLSFDPKPAVSNDFDGVAAPVVADSTMVEPCDVPVPGERFEVTGVSVSPRRVAAGDSVEVTFAYRRDRASAYSAGVLFHVRFDHESLGRGASFPGDKYVRRARERWGGERFRFRVDLPAGHGVYEPDLWPLGTALRERFRVAVPSGAATGRYQVEVRAVEETLLPNFDLRDVLFNRDHYSGNACTSIDVHGAEPVR